MPPGQPSTGFAFLACFHSRQNRTGSGHCPGWPKATPQGPQGLDSGRSQRTMPGWKQGPVPPWAGAPPGSAQHDAWLSHPPDAAPQVTQGIPATAAAKPTHETGRGASNDGQPILKPVQMAPDLHSELVFLVELWGFEPQTSCMPWEMLTFNTGKC